MYCDWPRLQRCCFCLPLRRGVLVVGYLKLFWTAFLIGLYSYAVHESTKSVLILNHATIGLFPSELNVFINCVEFVLDALLIYGAHKKLVLYVKVYFYYSVATILACILLQIVQLADEPFLIDILLTFGFIGFCIQLYLLMLVHSLMKKLEVDGPHMYENQLHQFINGQVKLESNGVYNPSTVPCEV